MNFDWSQKEKQLKQDAISFAQRNLNKDFEEREQRSVFSRECWKKCADFGIQGMAVPVEFGGRESANILSTTLFMEGLGYGCRDVGLLFGLNTQIWTVQLPILEFGSAEQKKRFLPAMCSGEKVACDAMSEPNAGSDVYNQQTTATKTDGGYLLNGTKCLITLAPIADQALVFATVDTALGKWGITAFLVDLSSEGVYKSKPMKKMGLRTIPIGEIRFENCFIPQENRLGEEGAGFAISQISLEHERCCIMASHVGAIDYLLEQTLRYCTTRKQFGQSVGGFQSVSNRIADMKTRLETARLLLYRVAWLKQQRRSAVMDAAILKLYLSESFTESSLDAIRIHGGNGYLAKTGIEHYMRDAIGGLLYAGTSDIQRNIIAGLLGVQT